MLGQTGQAGESFTLDQLPSMHLDRPESHFKPSGRVQFVLKLLDYWNLNRDDAIRLLGFEANDAEYVDKILRGEERLHGRDIKERITHLFFIRGYLRALFRDLKTENEWLREKHDLLDGEKPLSMLLEGSFANVLDVRDYVDTVVRR